VCGGTRHVFAIPSIDCRERFALITPSEPKFTHSGATFLPRTDKGGRVYAIGDIHGRYDLLTELLDRVGEHSAALPPSQSLHIVFLGDIIDRGPQSAQALELIFDLQSKSDNVILLLGNHEEAMLHALDGSVDSLRGWMGVGGDATVRSFGLEPWRRDEDPVGYLRRLRGVIPREWVGWLKRLPLSARSGDYFFCHAGVRPGVSLRRQLRQDLLWIREDFLDDPAYHGAIIVHGHSVEQAVSIRHNRIGIDTGAYHTGVLTALYLEDTRQEIISTGSA